MSQRPRREIDTAARARRLASLEAALQRDPRQRFALAERTAAPASAAPRFRIVELVPPLVLRAPELDRRRQRLADIERDLLR